MAIDIKPLLRAGLAAQSTALLIENIKTTSLKNNNKLKKKTLSKLLKAGTTNIVGIPLLQTQGQIIEGL